MLVEFGLVEQRFAAVMEVINDGQPVTDVARRFGVSRQTVRMSPLAWWGFGRGSAVRRATGVRLVV